MVGGTEGSDAGLVTRAGNPVEEECKWRKTNLLSSTVVFWGVRGWELGLQFRGSAVVRTTIILG